MYVYYFDEFTKSQYVIPATELADMAGCVINSITYYTQSNDIPYTTNSTVDIFVKEVDYTILTAYEAKEDCQVVYSGTVDFVAAGGGGECVINFATPYTYKGGNLLVGCENITNSSYKNIYFYGQTLENGVSAGSSNSSSTNDVGFEARNFMPKVTFYYENPLYPMPQNLNVANTGDENATIEWTISPSENTLTGYAYQYKVAGDEWPTEWSNLDASATSVTLEGLTANTFYNFQIKALYGDFESATATAKFNTYSNLPITFADANVKALCVANWDTNGDGELSYAEAAAVTDLGQVFMDNGDIHTFDELQYFTGLTFIGENAFSYCGLTSVVLPNTVTEIRGGAFYACGGLLSITFSASLTSIGYASFYASGLLSISIPASVTNINGFGANGNLESIIVEEGNTVYDSRDNCNAIIETSTNRLLLGCKNTVIPNTVVTIAGGALYYAQIETVTIPASVTEIQDNAFGSSLIEITVSESNPVYDSRDNCNAIIETSTNKLIVGSKNTVIPNTVASIGREAFAYRYRDEPYNITIPESVTSIGENAFVGCNGIASITVLAEVPPTLGNGAFSEVPKDIPVYVPCGTRSAYQSAEGWSEFTNIIGARITVTVNPANVGTVSGAGAYECGETCTLTATAYEGSTFINWTENNEVVSTEAEYTFTVAGDRTLVANFDGSNFITFADANVKTLCVANWDTNGDGELSYAEAAAVTDLGQVFSGNQYIQTFAELQYFTGLTSICNGAFDSSSITSVVLPNTVTAIRNHAFAASRIESVTIPASVTNIETYSFHVCSYLSEITVSESNPVYDSRDNCNAIIETSTNKLIAGSKTTVIPNTVTTIGDNAFSYRFMDGSYNFTIPESVTLIESEAIQGNQAIASITVLAEVPPTLGYNVFCNVPKNIPVNVPCGTRSAYQTASGWNEFTNYQENCQIQTIELSEGWNWFSTYIEAKYPVTMLQMIEAALGDNAIQISSSEVYTENDGGDWWGELDEVGVANEQMYMILVETPCTIELQGAPANPTNHAITINPGWNWIGFPCDHEMSIEEALNGFEAEEGDVFANSDLFTEFEDGEWYGDVNTLTPGQGFMYFSNSTETKTLIIGGAKAKGNQ